MAENCLWPSPSVHEGNCSTTAAASLLLGRRCLDQCHRCRIYFLLSVQRRSSCVAQPLPENTSLCTLTADLITDPCSLCFIASRSRAMVAFSFHEEAARHSLAPEKGSSTVQLVSGNSGIFHVLKDSIFQLLGGRSLTIWFSVCQ